jgi:hypothetical protein
MLSKELFKLFTPDMICGRLRNYDEAEFGFLDNRRGGSDSGNLAGFMRIGIRAGRYDYVAAGGLRRELRVSGLRPGGQSNPPTAEHTE